MSAIQMAAAAHELNEPRSSFFLKVSGAPIRNPVPQMDPRSRGTYEFAAFTGFTLQRRRSPAAPATACRRERWLGNVRSVQKSRSRDEARGARPPGPATVGSTAARRASLRVVSPASAHPHPAATPGPSLARQRPLHNRYNVPLVNLRQSHHANSVLTVRAPHLVRGNRGCLRVTPRFVLRVQINRRAGALNRSAIARGRLRGPRASKSARGTPIRQTESARTPEGSTLARAHSRTSRAVPRRSAFHSGRTGGSHHSDRSGSRELAWR
jgi:hypothetical protein